MVVVNQGVVNIDKTFMFSIFCSSSGDSFLFSSIKIPPFFEIPNLFEVRYVYIQDLSIAFQENYLRDENFAKNLAPAG